MGTERQQHRSPVGAIRVRPRHNRLGVGVPGFERGAVNDEVYAGEDAVGVFDAVHECECIRQFCVATLLLRMCAWRGGGHPGSILSSPYRPTAPTPRRAHYFYGGRATL